jgi:hypothetical protein
MTVNGEQGAAAFPVWGIIIADRDPTFWQRSRAELPGT